MNQILTMSADHALKDPDIADHWGGDEEGVQAFLGENLHLVTAKNSKTNSVTTPNPTRSTIVNQRPFRFETLFH